MQDQPAVYGQGLVGKRSELAWNQRTTAECPLEQGVRNSAKRHQVQLAADSLQHGTTDDDEPLWETREARS